MQTTPVKKNLEIKQKTSKTYEFTFKQDGSTIDITGWTIFFTLKPTMSTADADATIKKTVTTHSNATLGETVVELSAVDTNLTPGSYYYDFKFKTDDGNIGVMFEGRYTISKITTQRES